MWLLLFSKIGAGAIWCIVYALIIRRASIDKIHGMPVPAILCNMGWEFIFSFIYPPVRAIELIIHVLWFIMSVWMLRQFFIYRPLNARKVSSGFFKTVFICASAGLICFIVFASSAVSSPYASILYALIINLVMSFSFVLMHLWRENKKGQSMSIAFLKFAGTFMAFIYCYFFVAASTAFAAIYLLIFILDVLYLILMFLKPRAELV